MTKQEAKAMNDLLNDDTIILRPIDKGSGIVIMDADKYKDEIESDLNDNTTYKQIDDRGILKTENKIKKLIEEMYKRNSISKEMKAYLLPKDTRPGRVQGTQFNYQDCRNMITDCSQRKNLRVLSTLMIQLTLKQRV